MFAKKGSDVLSPASANGGPGVQKMPSLGSILRRRKESEDSMGSSSSPVSSGSGAQNSRKPSVLFFGRRKTAFEELGIFKLSSAELAFLPNEVRTRLGRAVGHLPPAPSVFKSRGAVLFVDVSGFTKLGSELRNQHGPEKGAEFLADRITSVLATLTTICLDHGGDVSKFAGDALLCVWENGPEDTMFTRAKDCSIAMLAAMREISKSGVKLDIHGGLARGSILHFHLGSSDDRLRWYLMAGEAMAGAACLVDAASPGEIMCAETVETTRSVRTVSQASMMYSQAGSPRNNSSNGGDGHPSNIASPPPQHRSNTLWSPKSGTGNAAGGVVGNVPEGRKYTHGTSISHHPLHEMEVSLEGPNPTAPGGGKGNNNNSRDKQSTSSPALMIHNNHSSPVKRTSESIGGDGGGRRRNDTVTRNSDQKNHFLFMAQLASGAKVPQQHRSDLEFSFPKPFEGRGTLLSVTSEAMRERAASSFHVGDTPLTIQPREDSARSRVSTSQSSSVETIVVLTAESTTTTQVEGGPKSRGRVATEEDPVLRAGLPRTCNVYIPKSLRRGAMEDVRSEMKKGVSIVFVDIEDMALSDLEMERQTIGDVKLDSLNSSFVKMTRITHAFGGEVRDMLFDDKGCVFIAMFGAHGDDEDASGGGGSATSPRAPEARELIPPAQRMLEKQGSLSSSSSNNQQRMAMRTRSVRNLVPQQNMALEQSSELRACKAAIAINSAVESCRVGVSTGTCFVGMCGVEKRHDFIVIGHEVNMAARLMVQAERGQVVVSPEVYAVASKMLPFTERTVQMQKKNSTTTSVAYVADPSTSRRESFLAEYRYELFDSDFFVGRSAELELVEDSLNKMCLSPTSSHSGCIVIEADLGMGKSAFVSRVRKMGKGRISICHGTCRDPLDEFQPWRSILESLTGLRADMKDQEIRQCLHNFEVGGGATGRSGAPPPIDYNALARIFPFFIDVFNLTEPVVDDWEEDIFGEKHRRSIAAVGRTVASLLVLGNAASKRAGARGTLVVIENVERIDISSLLLLEYLIDHLDSAKRLALCITVKTRNPISSSNMISSSNNNHHNGPVSATDNHMGRRASLSATPETMTHESKRMSHVYTVVQKAAKVKSRLSLTLPGLPRDDCETLVTRALGHRASPKVNEFLYKITKGCPMHLTMLLQYCKEHRLISRKGGAEYEWTKDPASSDVLSNQTISTIEGVIRQRYEEGMDKEGKEVLRLASIIQSGEFDAIFLHEGLLTAVKRNLSEMEILRQLRQARNLGFVIHVEDKTRPEREHAWSFKHNTVADVIFSTVPKDTALMWAEKIEDSYKALELRLKLGFFGRVDDFEKV